MVDLDIYNDNLECYLLLQYIHQHGFYIDQLIMYQSLFEMILIHQYQYNYLNQYLIYHLIVIYIESNLILMIN